MNRIRYDEKGEQIIGPPAHALMQAQCRTWALGHCYSHRRRGKRACPDCRMAKALHDILATTNDHGTDDCGVYVILNADKKMRDIAREALGTWQGDPVA